MFQSYGQRARCVLGVSLSLAFGSLFAPTGALAVPVAGPSGAAFYAPPALVQSGHHGDLIWYRSAPVSLGAGAPAANAWNVLYQSTDANGVANAVTGTVFQPVASWAGSGPRPIVAYAVGTHGLAQGCAPSMQFAQGTDYENANIVAALKAGYSVLVPDYAGYTTGQTPTYLAGVSEGHAVLDIVQAAHQIPVPVGFSADSPVAVWGYSQGGQAAAWAGQQQADYVPNLKLVGVAAGGVPGDFLASGLNLEGSTGASFLFGGLIGLGTQYPAEVPLNTLLNTAGQAAAKTAESQCVFQSLFTLMNADVLNYTVAGASLPNLLGDAFALPGLFFALEAQNLGQWGSSIKVPLYLYHGQADEFIPLGQAELLKQTYCQNNPNVTFDLYPSEHIVTQFQAAAKTVAWLGQRFAGATVTGNCTEKAPAPQSTANKGGGAYVVSLNDWTLGGSLTLKSLGQTVNLPAGSTMTAATDLTNQKLQGNLVIPPFSATVWVFFPFTFDLMIQQSNPIVGTVSLDNSGQLHIHGTTSANITLAGYGTKCTTANPVQFPLNFDGPVSALGSGALTFPGTTTIPPLTGAGCSLFSSLIAGAGQTFTFSVTPPASVAW